MAQIGTFLKERQGGGISSPLSFFYKMFKLFKNYILITYNFYFLLEVFQSYTTLDNVFNIMFNL